MTADAVATGHALPALGRPFSWRERDGLPWLEAELPGAVAAFSTRLGGESTGPFRSLNLGILTDDEPARVLRNRERLAAALGREPELMAMGLQVHGTDVIAHDRRPPPVYGGGADELPEADGHATADAALTPIVLVADCVPLVLAAPGAVAVVHCGWRGLAGGIAERAVATLSGLVSAEPREMAAALGPRIGPCCYEVGEQVRAAFRARGHSGPAVAGATLDLSALLRAELASAGLSEGAIHDCGLCTSCRPDLFFSHRRDGGITGRQAGLAWLVG